MQPLYHPTNTLLSAGAAAAAGARTKTPLQKEVLEASYARECADITLCIAAGSAAQ